MNSQMTGKSNEKPENFLYEACLDVIEGSAGVDELQNAHGIAVSELKETRKDFNFTLSGQSRKVQHACKKLVAQINETFDEYEHLLETSGSYFQTFDKSILENSLEKILSVSEKLDRQFYDFRDTALAAMGPTGLPGLNLVIHITGKIRNNEEMRDDPLFHISRESELMESLLAEMEQAEQTEELAARKEAAMHFLDAMDALVDHLESGDRALLDVAIQELNTAAEMFNSLPGVVNPEELAKSPTQSPLANIIINSVPGLISGEISQDFFGDILQRLWDELDLLRFRYNAISRAPAESSRVEEESEILEDVITAFEEVLNEFFDAMDNWKPDRFASLTEKLKTIVDELYQSMKSFQNIAETEGKTPCVKCGHFNSPGIRFCEKCNFKLPVIAGEKQRRLDMKEGEAAGTGEQTGPVMTENVRKLFESAEMAAEGKIPPEEFSEVVNWMENLLSQAYKAAGPVPPIEVEKLQGKEKETAGSIDKLLKEASDIYQRGLEDFEVGLSFFRQFADGGSSESIRTGKQMIMQGMDKLQKVQKATEVFTKKS